jgi:hypothetical protein
MIFGGYGVAREITVRQVVSVPGPPSRLALFVLRPGASGAFAFAFFLVMFSAIPLLVPLLIAGLAYLRGSSPSAGWRWQAAWLAAVASGAAVEAAWLTMNSQQPNRDVLPGQLLWSPLMWSPLIMFLGHLAVGVAMLAVLRAATRSHQPRPTSSRLTH